MLKSLKTFVRIASLAFVLCCVAHLLAPHESAEGETDTDSGKGVVKDGPVQVYSEPSARSKVVKSLNKGEEVIVGIEMKTSDGAWCGITEQGMSSISGYIPCESIEQRKTAPVLWKSVGSKRVANLSRSTASRNLSSHRPYSDITVLLYMTTW